MGRIPHAGSQQGCRFKDMDHPASDPAVPDTTVATLIGHVSATAGAMADPITLYGREGDDYRILWVDARSAPGGGGAASQVGLLLRDVFPPDVVAKFEARAAEAIEGNKTVRYESAVSLPGGVLHIEVTLRPLTGETGAIYLLASQHDISERTAIAEAQERERRRLVKMLEYSTEVIWSIDRDLCVVSVSPAVRHVLGYRPEDLIGTESGGLVGVTDRQHARSIEQGISREPGTPHRFELWAHHRDGHRVLLDVTVTNRLDDPDLGAIIVNTRDITRIHQAQTELERLATHDDLTGLPNRRQLESTLSSLLNAASGDSTIGVQFIDIDGFKNVNDRFGHHGGDVLLTAVAARLVEAAGVGCIVARFGGDEFVVVTLGPRRLPHHMQLAESLQECLRTPFEIAGEQVQLSAAIGIAHGSGVHGDETAALLRDADLAMYAAKADGPGKIVLYEPSLRTSAANATEDALTTPG